MANYIVGILVGRGTPVQNSKIFTCKICRREIYLAITGAARTKRGYQPLCLECFGEKYRAGEVQPCDVGVPNAREILIDLFGKPEPN